MHELKQHNATWTEMVALLLFLRTSCRELVAAKANKGARPCASVCRCVCVHVHTCRMAAGSLGLFF